MIKSSLEKLNLRGKLALICRGEYEKTNQVPVYQWFPENSWLSHVNHEYANAGDLVLVLDLIYKPAYVYEVSFITQTSNLTKTLYYVRPDRLKEI